MVSEISSSFNDTEASLEIVEKKLDSDRTSHTNKREFFKETRPVKKLNISHKA